MLGSSPSMTSGMSISAVFSQFRRIFSLLATFYLLLR